MNITDLFVAIMGYTVVVENTSPERVEYLKNKDTVYIFNDQCYLGNMRGGNFVNLSEITEYSLLTMVKELTRKCGDKWGPILEGNQWGTTNMLVALGQTNVKELYKLVYSFCIREYKY